MFHNLPIELLYEIQLCALSEALPYVDRSNYTVFSSTHATFRADYIVSRYLSQAKKSAREGLVTYSLLFPLCNAEVLEAILDSPVAPRLLEEHAPRLPRRLFRSLVPRASPWTSKEMPLSFLKWIYSNPRIPHPDVDSHDGYALTRAVHAEFLPLVLFLLEHGASPKHKDALAVRVAIKKKNLSLVRLLLERDESYAYKDSEMNKNAIKTVTWGRKRRRVADRMEPTVEMLKIAVTSDARDIVSYLLDKGVRPDMQTLLRMRTSGLSQSTTPL